MCHTDAYSLTPGADSGGGTITHLSFSPDETVLAACAAGVVTLYETRALLAAARLGGGVAAAVAPFRRQVPGGCGGGAGGTPEGEGEDAEHVRDLLWLPDGQGHTRQGHRPSFPNP